MAEVDVEYEWVDPATLVEYPNNPRRGDVDAIRESIEANGFVGAIVVQRSTRFVLSGNHTLRAVLAIGMDRVPVKWEDVDDAAARRIVLAMNRAADLGWYENEALLDLLDAAASDDLYGTLYESADVDALRSVLVGDDDADDEDETTTSSSGSGGGSAPRSLIIPLSVEDYDATLDRLVRLRSAWGLATNAEVVVAAIADAAADV